MRKAAVFPGRRFCDRLLFSGRLKAIRYGARSEHAAEALVDARRGDGLGRHASNLRADPESLNLR